MTSSTGERPCWRVTRTCGMKRGGPGWKRTPFVLGGSRTGSLPETVVKRWFPCYPPGECPPHPPESKVGMVSDLGHTQRAEC